MLLLIWKNISRRRTQSTLTVAITMMTVMVFILVLGVFLTMQHGLELSRERLGADVVVLPEEADVDGYELLFTAQPENCYMDASLFEQIAAMEGVAAASPQFYSQTVDGTCCDFGYEMRVIGFDQDTDFILEPYFHLQEFDVLQDNEIILGGNFTDYVGKKSSILGRQFLVVGELYPTGTGMDDTIFMTIDMARALTANSESLNSSENLADLWKDKDPNNYISAIMLKLDEGVDAEKFADRLYRYSGLPVRCVATGGTVSALQEQLSAVATVLFALWMAALIIAVMALLGRFNALAKDRKKEIGLLRAIGMQKGQVFRLIIGEACTMAVMGGLLGSILACLCMETVVDFLQRVFLLPQSVWSIGLALLCILIGTIFSGLLGFLSALYPAKKSAELEPQSAITQGEVN